MSYSLCAKTGPARNVFDIIIGVRVGNANAAAA